MLLLVFFALIDAAGSTRFLNDDSAKSWEGGAQPLPYPARELLTGWVGKPFDLIEIVMVKLVIERLKSLFDVAKVHHPASMGVNRSAHMQLDAERMAV